MDNGAMKRMFPFLVAFLLSCGSGGGSTDGAGGTDETVFDAWDIPGTMDGAETDVDLTDQPVPDEDVLPDVPVPDPSPDPVEPGEDLSTGDLPPEDVAVAPPPRPRITVNGIPDTMNGKEPFVLNQEPGQAFRLRVPTGRFTIDLYQRDGEPWEGPAWIEASALVHLVDQDVPAGANLVPLLDCDSLADPLLGPDESDLHTRCRLPPESLDPAPDLQITGRFIDAGGGPGPDDAMTLEITDLPSHLDPFPQTDTWLVVLSRDLFAPELVSAGDGTYDILPGYVPEGNGTPDLDEALVILGLLSDNEAFSTAARALFVDRVRSYSNAIFGLDEEGQPTPQGVNLALVFEGDPGAPLAEDWSVDAGFSMIAVGSDPNDTGIANNTVGMAAIDWNNQKVEDNAKYNRGVFVTSIVRQVLTNALGALVVQEISPLDGTPLGMYPGDEMFLDPGFDPDTVEDERLALRFTLFDTIMDFATLAVASTLCHEMGHSLGLVPSGPPPQGLFAGMKGLSFTESDPGSAHIDTPGLNVMQTGKVTSYLEVFDGLPRFNALNLAYLRRQLVVGGI